jgi:hypothetical protein
MTSGRVHGDGTNSTRGTKYGGFICKAKNKICKGKYRIQIDYGMNCDE